uniref:Uncharacterized protein n=1 Tax=Oryzias latipes TaxID=8090 RepID=A0A3B3H645_ORYLA
FGPVEKKRETCEAPATNPNKATNKTQIVSNHVLIFWKTGSPEKWIRFGSSCYFFSEERKSWDKAREFSREADLVVINSKDENLFFFVCFWITSTLTNHKRLSTSLKLHTFEKNCNQDLIV